MISILMIVPIIFTALLFLIFGGIKSQNRGDETMIKSVYVYLVLFATLMMTIGGSVGVFMAAADIVAPQPHYQSFEDYKQWGHQMKVEGTQNDLKLTEEELRNNYEAMVASEKERTILRAKNSLIKSLGWIIIPLPIFIYFQRRLNHK